MTRNEVVAALLRRRILIAVLAALGLLGGAGYAVLAPKVFSSTAQVLLTVEADSAADRLQGSTYVAQILPTYASAVTSSAVLEPVKADLAPRMTLSKFQRRVDVRTTSDSALLTITTKSATAEGAYQLTDAITSRFVSIAPGLISPSLDTPTPGPTPSQVPSAAPAKVVLALVDHPSVPITPDSPSLRLGLPVGLAAGLVIGAGLALLLRRIDTRVDSLERIAALTGAPILAVMPRVETAAAPPNWDWPDSATASSAGGDHGKVSATSAWPFAESGPWADSTSLLRSALYSWEHPDEILLLTGIVPESGTSTVVASLACAVARTGVKTIAIDANLRSPALHSLFGIDQGPGLAEVLDGSVEPRQAERPIAELDNLTLVTAGTPKGEGDLLASLRLTPAVTALARSRTVLVDAPAILGSPAVRALALIVSATVLVVPLNSVTEQQLTAAVAEVDRSNRPLKGVVVTPGAGVPDRSPKRWWHRR